MCSAASYCLGHCIVPLSSPFQAGKAQHWHKQYLVRTSRHHFRFQMPPAAAKAPSQPAPETAAAQSDLRAPLSARESPGKQKIARGDTEVPLPFASQLVDLLGVTFQDAAGRCTCLRDWMEATETDGLLVMHEGHVISEIYCRDTTPSTNHALGSLTRNIVASAIAILAEQKKLDLDAPVETYMPEMSNSGFAGATVQQLLDMRSGVASSMMKIMQAMGWSQAEEGSPDPSTGVHKLLLTLPKEVSHGGPFKYRAGDTELLGCLCERVANQPMGELVSELIWQPLGAQQDADITLDKRQTPFYSGGMSASLQDTARFGFLWLNDGTCNGKQILPPAFVHATQHGDKGAIDAFVNSAAPNNKHFFGLMASPGKMYKNQTWNLDEKRGTFLMYGAAGQMIFTDPPAELMCTVLSSWPGAFVPERVQGWLNAFEALQSHLAPHTL